jgi:hypothetical protein
MSDNDMILYQWKIETFPRIFKKKFQKSFKKVTKKFQKFLKI